MLSWWSDWGSTPTWNDSHTHCIHTQGVWLYSYAVYWALDPPSCPYYHTCCWTSFVKSWIVEWRSMGIKVIIMDLFRLHTNMEWSPYLLHTCARCLSLITCNGLTDGSTIMPLLPYLMDQICILPTLWWRSWGTNVIMVELFRLQTHMDWSSHPQHSYARCLKSFICYGLTNWSTILPILTHLLDQICILLKNRVTQLGYKCYHGAVWLSLQTNMTWSPHPLRHSYGRCYTSFICYGLNNKSTILPLSTHYLALISKPIEIE